MLPKEEVKDIYGLASSSGSGINSEEDNDNEYRHSSLLIAVEGVKATVISSKSTESFRNILKHFEDFETLEEAALARKYNNNLMI